jgi:hypothetical protein
MVPLGRVVRSGGSRAYHSAQNAVHVERVRMEARGLWSRLDRTAVFHRRNLCLAVLSSRVWVVQMSKLVAAFKKFYPEALRYVITAGSAWVLAIGNQTHWHF